MNPEEYLKDLNSANQTSSSTNTMNWLDIQTQETKSHVQGALTADWVINEVRELIDLNQAEEVYNRLQNYDKKLYWEIGKILIEKNPVLFIKNIEKFQFAPLGEIIIEHLNKKYYISSSFPEKFMESIEDFPWIDYDSILNCFAKNWFIDLIIKYKHKYTQKIEKCMWRAGKRENGLEIIVNNLHEFDSEIHLSIFEEIIKNGGWYHLWKFLWKVDQNNQLLIPWEYHKDIIIKLMTIKDQGVHHLWWSTYISFENYVWLDKQIALLFLDNEETLGVFDYKNNIKSFTWLDNEVALLLAKKWQWKLVLNNREYFKDLQLDKQLFDILFDNNKEISLENISLFSWLDQESLSKILKYDSSFDFYWVLDYFEFSDYQELALSIIKTGNYTAIENFIENINRFPELNYHVIATEILRVWFWKLIIQNMDIFTWVDIVNVVSDALDDEVKQWYVDLWKMVGNKKLLHYITSENIWFFNNIHDSLVFMSKIVELDEERKKLYKTIIFDRVFHEVEDSNDFWKLLGSFDMDEYQKYHENKSLKNYAEFQRIALLHKNNIAIPKDASKFFTNAMNTLISAPWVDVNFLREMIAIYSWASFHVFREQDVNILKKYKPEVTVLNNAGLLDQTSLLSFENRWKQYLVPILSFLKHSWYDINDTNFETRKSLKEELKDIGINISLEYDIQYYYDNTPETTQDYSNARKETFASQLIDIIEWIDDIDSRQIIPAFEKTIAFDDLNKLLFDVLWINEINSQTWVFQKLIKQSSDLKTILIAIQEQDKHTRQKIVKQFDELIQQDPINKNKYIVDRDKELKTHCLIEYAQWNKVKQLNYQNIDESIFENVDDEDIQLEDIFTCFNNFITENTAIIIETLYTLYQNKAAVCKHSELSYFQRLCDIWELIEDKLWLEKEIQNIRESDITGKQKNVAINQLKQEKFNSISQGKLSELLENSIFDCIGYIYYLGINNIKRQANFKPINKDLMEIFGQKRYIDHNMELKEKWIIEQNSRPIKSYIDGYLQIDEQDEQKLKEIFKQYWYDKIWRQLKIEIAKKSDPRGWVCWDYTDCCMPLTTAKNQEYLLREDMAYFLISIVDGYGNEDLVAQSVLVAADDIDKDEKSFEALAVDNIEIANRAVKYTPVLAKAYQVLKSVHQDKKIIIWSSHNDDAWVVTGTCTMQPIDISPVQWKIKQYSDCFNHSEAYIFNDPNETIEEGELQYYWLQKYSLDTNHLKYFISKEKLEYLKRILTKIWTGEDDGEGWLTFPDNYSVVFWWEQDYKWYIVAADYIVEEYENSQLTVESIDFINNISFDEKSEILKKYFIRKWFQSNDEIEEIVFKDVQDPDIIKIIKKVFKKFPIESYENNLCVKK